GGHGSQTTDVDGDGTQVGKPAQRHGGDDLRLGGQDVSTGAGDDLGQLTVGNELVYENLGGHQATDVEALVPGHAHDERDRGEEHTENVLKLGVDMEHRQNAAEDAVEATDQRDERQHHDHDVTGDLGAVHGSLRDHIEDVLALLLDHH